MHTNGFAIIFDKPQNRHENSPLRTFITETYSLLSRSCAGASYAKQRTHVRASFTSIVQHARSCSDERLLGFEEFSILPAVIRLVTFAHILSQSVKESSRNPIRVPCKCVTYFVYHRKFICVFQNPRSFNKKIKLLHINQNRNFRTRKKCFVKNRICFI